ncbi:multicopper oxidase domain-containing protein, partial [Serratia marcescens]|nr:multicopper oxidase domain-containing protein [Serratia marcescens]
EKGDEVTITAGEAAGIAWIACAACSSRRAFWCPRVLTLRLTGLLPLVTDNLPMRLLADQLLDGSASRTAISAGEGGVGINGAIWDMNRIDVQAQQGTRERWNIHADTPQVVPYSGRAVPDQTRQRRAQPMAEDRGWKDTVWVDGDVELLVYFNQPTSEHFPFLYYSQTLEMADRGTAGS